jgi:hypothetical protein
MGGVTQPLIQASHRGEYLRDSKTYCMFKSLRSASRQWRARAFHDAPS